MQPFIIFIIVAIVIGLVAKQAGNGAHPRKRPPSRNADSGDYSVHSPMGITGWDSGDGHKNSRDPHHGSHSHPNAHHNSHHGSHHHSHHHSHHGSDSSSGSSGGSGWSDGGGGSDSGGGGGDGGGGGGGD